MPVGGDVAAQDVLVEDVPLAALDVHFQHAQVRVLKRAHDLGEGLEAVVVAADAPLLLVARAEVPPREPDAEVAVAVAVEIAIHADAIATAAYAAGAVAFL